MAARRTTTETPSTLTTPPHHNKAKTLLTTTGEMVQIANKTTVKPWQPWVIPPTVLQIPATGGSNWLTSERGQESWEGFTIMTSVNYFEHLT